MASPFRLGRPSTTIVLQTQDIRGIYSIHCDAVLQIDDIFFTLKFAHEETNQHAHYTRLLTDFASVTSEREPHDKYLGHPSAFVTKSGAATL